MGGADVRALAALLDKLKASIAVAGEREHHQAVRRHRRSFADARDRGMSGAAMTRQQSAIGAGQDRTSRRLWVAPRRRLSAGLQPC